MVVQTPTYKEWWLDLHGVILNLVGELSAESGSKLPNCQQTTWKHLRFAFAIVTEPNCLFFFGMQFFFVKTHCGMSSPARCGLAPGDVSG